MAIRPSNTRLEATRSLEKCSASAARASLFVCLAIFSSERQRTSTAEELKQTRDVLHALRLTLTQEMGTQREAMLERLAATTESLNAKIDARLGEIAGKVNERLDEGFKKTTKPSST